MYSTADPRLRCSMKYTFSITTHGTELRSSSSNNLLTIVLFWPVIPRLSPAMDRFWHGKPAVTTSVPSGSRSRLLMSPCSRTSPHRCRRTTEACSSLSHSKIAR